MNFLADENFNNYIVRGVRRQEPTIDLLTVQEAGLSGMDDPDLLAWAASADRIVLTHDVNTMPNFAYDRIRSGEPMPGLFGVPHNLAVRSAIDEIMLIAHGSLAGEWEGQVRYLPLR
jgi:hypothetical protein